MQKFLLTLFALFFLLSLADAQLPKPRRYMPTSASARKRYDLVSADARFWKQRRYEFTLGMGSTQFFGDIGGYSNSKNLLGLKDFSFHNTQFNVTAALRYRIMNDVSARINLAFGYLHSTDIRGSNETRGFESTTRFIEPSVIGEYHFNQYMGQKSYLFVRGKRNVLRPFLKSFDFYVFTGLGALSYNVTPNDLLAPRATKTTGFTPVVPAGMGANMVLSRYFNLGLELGGRYAFSDALDGYTSQFSRSNDIYYFLNLNITFKIKTGARGLPSF